MEDSLYIKLEDHSEYREAMQQIDQLLDSLEEKMEHLEKIRTKEQSYLDTWKEKSEKISDKVEETKEILDANRPS